MRPILHVPRVIVFFQYSPHWVSAPTAKTSDITQFLQQNSNCTEYGGSEQDLVNITLGTADCTYWLSPSISGMNYSTDYFDSNHDYMALIQGLLTLAWNYSPDSLIVDASLFKTEFLFVDSLNGQDPIPFGLSDVTIIPHSFAQLFLIKTLPLAESMETGFVDMANICAISVCAKKT